MDICNSRTWDMETKGPEIQSHPWLYSESRSVWGQEIQSKNKAKEREQLRSEERAQLGSSMLGSFPAQHNARCA